MFYMLLHILQHRDCVVSKEERWSSVGPRPLSVKQLSPIVSPYWGAYTRHIDADEHQQGQRNSQKIKRKHLTLRTRIKRLTRKTICFSKSIQMHDIVIGLFVNRYEFGLLL